ncbi:hypothetical protein EKL28_18100 [Staphylococcus aureus]|nr:hypothetical protein EKL28_18100 [Staphylococcus aureus]
MNVDLLSNYACELIFEKYGYDVEKHGKFDRNTGYTSRYENNLERIGKKYQWLNMVVVLVAMVISVDIHFQSKFSPFGKIW